MRLSRPAEMRFVGDAHGLRALVGGEQPGDAGVGSIQALGERSHLAQGQLAADVVRGARAVASCSEARAPRVDLERNEHLVVLGDVCC